MESKKTKKHRSRRHCSVPQCKSRCTNEISLFLFPKSKELAKQWAVILNMSQRLFKYTYVCSLHFDKSDFTLAMSAKKRRLKIGAIPSKNLPNLKETQPFEDFARRSRKRISKRISSEKMLKDEAKSSEVLAECRACLQPCPRGERRELFKCWDPPWTGMENTVAEDLVKLTNVQISETDRHSKILCQNCYIILQKANHFVEVVRKADQVLNQRYTNDDSKPTEDNNWPKPIKVDTNLCLYDNVEIKDECLSDEEYGYVNGDDGQDFSRVDVKIEAEEWHPQQPMLLNGAISFNHLNEELAKINGCTSAEEQNSTQSLLNEHLRPNNGNGMRYESDDADTNSLETRIKDEPSSDQDTESSVASDLPLECLLCSKSFLSISGLKAHVIAQHSYKTVRRKSNDMEENQFKYVCKICQRKFETSTDLMVHETCHNKCVCYGCNASFETFDLLTQHRHSCKAVNTKEVGKVLKLEDVQRLANVAQRILEVMTKYTIFCQDSEQGNIDECYQALLAVITQKEDSLCDELSDSENFYDLSDIDSIDDTLLEYDKHFLSDLDYSERSLDAVVEKTPLNSFDKTDDGFYSMDGPFKTIANASYPVVKLTRLNSATLDNLRRNIYLNEHSAISLDDSSNSFEEVTYLDSSILEMSDDTLCSNVQSAVDDSNTISKETINHIQHFNKISDNLSSNGIAVKSFTDPFNVIAEEVAINRDLNKTNANMTFNSAVNISKLIAEEKAIDRNKLSSGACLSAVFSPNPAAGETNINESGFDEFDDDFHSEDVSVCLDILSKYVIEETAENNISNKIDPNVPFHKTSVDTFNPIFNERASCNDASVNLSINPRCNAVAEIFEKANLDKSDKTYSNDTAPGASINVINCVEESTSLNYNCLNGSLVSNINISKRIEENAADCNISVVSSVKACKDIDNVTEGKSYDRSNEDFNASNISVCTANRSNLEGETAENNCDLDKVNEEIDLSKSISPVELSELILETPFKGFENINNNANSNDFSNNASNKIFEETAASFEKGHNDLYSNNFSMSTLNFPSRINPYKDITGDTSTSIGSQSCRIQHKLKINEKSNYNYKHKKPRIVEKDYTFIFKSIETRKLIPGCYSYCKYKCRNNITSRQRIKMFEMFWKMDLNTQRKFVNNNIHLNNQGYHTLAGKKRRTFINYVYILQISNQCVRVCKKFFEDTLSIVIISTLRKQNRPDKDIHSNKRRKNDPLKLDTCKNTHEGHKQYSHIVDSSQLNPYIKLINIEFDKKLRSYWSQVLNNTNDTNHSKYVKESNVDAIGYDDNTKLGIETNSYDIASFNSENQFDLSTNDVDVNNTNIDSCTADNDNRSLIETNIDAYKIESGIIQPDIDVNKLDIDNDYLDSKTDQLNIVKNQQHIENNRFDNDNNQPYTDKNQPNTANDHLDTFDNKLDTDNQLFSDDMKRDTNNSKLDSESNHFIIDNYQKYTDTCQLGTDNNQTVNDINYLDSEYNLLNNDENQRDTVNSRLHIDKNQIDAEINLLNIDKNQSDTDIITQIDIDHNKLDINKIKFDDKNNQLDIPIDQLDIDNNQFVTKTDQLHDNQSHRNVNSIAVDAKELDICPDFDICQLSCDSKETKSYVIESDTEIDNLNTRPEPGGYISCYNSLEIYHPDQKSNIHTHQFNINQIEINCNKSTTDNIDRLDTDTHQCAEVVHQFDDTNKRHVSDKSDTNLYNNQSDGGGQKQIELNNHESMTDQQGIDTNQSGTVIKPLFTDTKKSDGLIGNSQCQQIHYQPSDQLITNNIHVDTATDQFETDINQSTEAVVNEHKNENKQADININSVVMDTNKLDIRSPDIDTCRINTDTEVTEIGIDESITSTNLLNTAVNQSARNIHQQVTDINSLDISSYHPDISSYHPDINARKSDVHVNKSDTNQEIKQFEIDCNQSTMSDNNQLESDTNHSVVINNPSITNTGIPNVCIDNSATNACMFDTDTKSYNSNYHVENNTYNITNDTSDIFNPDVCKNKLEPKTKQMNINTVQPDEYIDHHVTDINNPDVIYHINSDVCQKDSDRSNCLKHHMKESSSNIHESGIHLSDFDIPQSNFNSFINSKIATEQANCASINNYVDTATYMDNRKKNKQKLANHKNKLQRIIGKGYKFMFRYKTTRSLMPGCYNCKYKCTNNITHEQRQNIFKEFWKMDLEAQTIFLNNNVLLINPFGYRKLEGVRSKLNHSFLLPLNNQCVRVCKKFFVNTLSIYMIDIEKHNCYISVVKSRMDPYVKLVDITFDKNLRSYLVPEPSSNHSLSLNMNSYQSEYDSVFFYTIHPDRVIRLPKVDTFPNTLSCPVNTQVASFDTCIANVNSQASIETYPFDTQLSHKQSQLSDVFVQPITVDVCQTSIDKCFDSENQSPKYTQLSNVDSQPIIKNICLASTEICSSYCDVQSSDRYTDLINVETQRNMDDCHFNLDTCYSNFGEEIRGIDVQSSSGEAQSFKAILKDWASNKVLNNNINIESQYLNTNSSSIDSNPPLVNVCTPFNKSIDMQETDLDIRTTGVETCQANINSYISGIDTQLSKLDDQIQKVDSGETKLKHYPSSFHTHSYKIDEQVSNIEECPSTIDKDRFSFNTQSCEIDGQVLSVDNSHETTEIYPSSLNNLKCEIDPQNSNGDLRVVESFNPIQSDFNSNSPMKDSQNSSIDICKVSIITCPSSKDIQPADVYKTSSESNLSDIHQARKETLASGFDIQPYKLDDQVQTNDKCLTLTETQHDIDSQSSKIKYLIPYLDSNHEILESNFKSQPTNTGCQISTNTFQVSTKTKPSHIEPSDITNDDASQTNIYNYESSVSNQTGLNLLENSFNVYKPDSINSDQNEILDKIEIYYNTSQVDNEPLSDITLLDSCETKQLLATHSINFGIEPHTIDDLTTIPATIATHPSRLDNQSSNVNIENINYVNNQAICLTEPFNSVVSQLQSKLHVQQINNQVQAISTDICQSIIHSSSSIYTTLSSTDSGDPCVKSQCQMDRQLISEVSNQYGIETYPSYFDTKSSNELIQPAIDERTNFKSAPTDHSSNHYALLSNVYSQPASVECLQTEIEAYPLYHDSQSKTYFELSHIESQSNEINSCHTSLDEIDSCQASFDAQPHTINITTPDVVAQSFKSILNDWAT